jgi:hypothetical protein
MNHKITKRNLKKPKNIKRHRKTKYRGGNPNKGNEPPYVNMPETNNPGYVNMSQVKQSSREPEYAQVNLGQSNLAALEQYTEKQARNAAIKASTGYYPAGASNQSSQLYALPQDYSSGSSSSGSSSSSGYYSSGYYSSPLGDPLYALSGSKPISPEKLEQELENAIREEQSNSGPIYQSILNVTTKKKTKKGLFSNFFDRFKFKQNPTTNEYQFKIYDTKNKQWILEYEKNNPQGQQYCKYTYENGKLDISRNISDSGVIDYQGTPSLNVIRNPWSGKIFAMRAQRNESGELVGPMYPYKIESLDLSAKFTLTLDNQDQNVIKLINSNNEYYDKLLPNTITLDNNVKLPIYVINKIRNTKVIDFWVGDDNKYTINNVKNFVASCIDPNYKCQGFGDNQIAYSYKIKLLQLDTANLKALFENQAQYTFKPKQVTTQTLQLEPGIEQNPAYGLKSGTSTNNNNIPPNNPPTNKPPGFSNPLYAGEIPNQGPVYEIPTPLYEDPNILLHEQAGGRYRKKRSKKTKKIKKTKKKSSK